VTFRPVAAALAASLALALPLASQTAPADLVRERSAFAEWLASAPNSPRAAVAQQPIGPGITLGPPGSDVPLKGVARHRITEQGGVVALEGASGRTVLPPGRPVAIGDHFIASGGVPGRRVITVYGTRQDRAAQYYPHDPGLVFTGRLSPPERPGTVRLLGLDGIEVEAAEAGTVLVPVGPKPARLIVRRIPTGEDESELEIFFRDETNAQGTYPAGRFVSLVPAGNGLYRLDFNRARNPFCAYSSAFPCPAPWRGNTIDARVEAGEKYLGGGLSTPPVGAEAQ
jgi:hypothetical protein